MRFHHGTDERYAQGCRCPNCTEAHEREVQHFRPAPKRVKQEPTTHWTRDAACAGYPTDWFFPDAGFPPAEAFALCARCPVAEPCKEEGKNEYGLWGGVYRGWRKGRKREFECETEEFERLIGLSVVEFEKASQ